MKLLGTTGTRNIPQNDEPLFVDYLLRPETSLYLDQFDGFVSGACCGWDAVFGSTLALTRHEQDHYVIVPANRSYVEYWWMAIENERIHVIEMPEGTDYRDRNQEIVKMSSYLFYCADLPEQHPNSRRSGTWQTVRLARSAGLKPTGIIINFDVSDGE